MTVRKAWKDAELLWDQLREIEPKLTQLEAQARELRPSLKGKPVDRIWYNSWKPRVNSLVGWEAIQQPEILQTMEAHGCVYFRILGILEGRKRYSIETIRRIREGRDGLLVRSKRWY